MEYKGGVVPVETHAPLAMALIARGSSDSNVFIKSPFDLGMQEEKSKKRW